MSQIHVVQIVKIHWLPPDGARCYSSTSAFDLLNFRSLPPELKPLEVRILNDGFLEFEFSPDLTDEPINLLLSDTDGEIRRLYAASGEGVKVEVFYYYPQTQELKSRWFGQMRPPDEIAFGDFAVRAESGFMSRLVLLPNQRVQETCRATFGGQLPTLDDIDDYYFCRYNRHTGGSVGNLNGGVPYTTCEKTQAACNARMSGSTVDGGPAERSFMGIEQGGFASRYSPRPGGTAVTKGNESNLKNPIRVILGTKFVRDFEILKFRLRPDPQRADRAFFDVLFMIGCGPIDLAYGAQINDSGVPANFQAYRVGRRAEIPIAFPGSNATSSYSGTSVFYGQGGYVADSYDPRTTRLLLAVHGYNGVRVYTTTSAFTEVVTRSRVWNLLECYTNKDWGRGYSHSRFDIQSFIDTDAWARKNIDFVRPDTGAVMAVYPRTFGEFVLEARPAQEQIRDLCRAGRLSIPFQENGKYKIVPLKKVDDLSSCPVFWDGTINQPGLTRNIIWQESGGVPFKPEISLSQISDAELPNKVVLTFEDSNNLDIERPLTFEDEEAQLRAGRVYGDTTKRVVEKRFTGMGVRRVEEAMRLGWLLLYLGEFDEGGLKNNLRVTFRCDHISGRTLKKYDVIKVVTSLLANFPFSYFRIIRLRHLSDGTFRVTAQAYPENYYNMHETETGTSSDLTEDLTPAPAPPKPGGIAFGSISYQDGEFSIPLI
jgi:hypothetical protein